MHHKTCSNLSQTVFNSFCCRRLGILNLYKTGNSLSLNIYRVFFRSETVTQRRIRRYHAEFLKKFVSRGLLNDCKTQGIVRARKSADYTGAIIVRKYN